MCFLLVYSLLLKITANAIIKAIAMIVTPINVYADFNSRRNLSAIIAINSEFVGFPLLADTV